MKKSILNIIFIFIFIFIFISLVFLLCTYFYMERKNIIFKKCLDVIPQENLLDIDMFKINIEICKKQS